MIHAKECDKKRIQVPHFFGAIVDGDPFSQLCYEGVNHGAFISK